MKSYQSINTFYIEHLGCAKNQVDAEILSSSLTASGLLEVFSPEEAGMIIVNSCSFLTSAVKESVDAVMDLKKRVPAGKIYLAGCLPGRYDAETLKSLLPEVDDIIDNKAAVMEADAPFKRTKTYGFPGSAYIKIAEGCENRCTYCAIPLIRGPLVSRKIPEIIEEMRSMLDRGYVEFNLIAQDLGAFGTERGGAELAELLTRAARLPGNFWVRLLYIHPDHFPPEVLSLCAEDKRFLPYFDLPFQHASLNVLKKMGRKGSKQSYLDRIDVIRQALPDAVIRSTFIVGFPGEGKKEFDELLSFQQEARLEWAGVFVYSREQGTPAFRMRGLLRHKLLSPIFRKRKARFETLQQTITVERLSRFVGKRLDVLIEEPVQGEDLFLGRAFIHAPEVDGAVVVHGRTLTPGTLVPCTITGLNGIDFSARPVK